MTQTPTTTVTDDFSEFYSANFRRVATQLYAYLGDHAEAQDVTQEAFCRAYARWDRIKGYANAGAWVRHVAWNLATSRLRHLRMAMRHLSRERPAHVEPPGSERVDLLRALACLPPNHRLAVVLHHLEELSTSEIARQRGVAESTVRSWLSRGRSKLAHYLLDSDGWPSPEFKPAGARAAAATVRRREIAKRSVTVVLVLAVLIPLSLLLIKRHSEPPAERPRKDPVILTPGPTPSARSLGLPAQPSVTGQGMDNLRFRDRLHGWSWDVGDNRYLVSTKDGGVTWYRVNLPTLDAGASFRVFSADDHTFTLEIAGATARAVPETYWHTKDSGATWVQYPVNDPPIEALRSVARYSVLCSDQINWIFVSQIQCAESVLVDVHENRIVDNQPPWRPRYTFNLTEAGGRLWMQGWDGHATRLVYTSDGTKTWQDKQLPPFPGEDSGRLEISPDGSQIWWITNSGLWKLVLSKWQRQLDQVGESGDWHLLDNDLWVTLYHGFAYFAHGQFVVVSELEDVKDISALEDGTLLVRRRDGTYYLGVGSGTSRTWSHLTG
jgi:RNA polymerase sigma-70 factor (ECF subfamily)